MLEIKFLLRMKADSTYTAEVGGNVFSTLQSTLKHIIEIIETYHEEDENDTKTTPKELIDLIGQY